MLQHQDTYSLSELKTQFVSQAKNPDFILNTVSAFRLSAAHHCFDQLKAKGFSLTSLFVSLLSLPFLSMNTVHQAVNEPLIPFIKARKDTFYRMKNCSLIDWRAILSVFAKQFIKISQAAADSQPNESHGYKCLIFDDSVLHKTGRRIEKISKVWDHVSNRSVLGFKLLLGLYYDGTSMLPVAFSLHREKGKKADKPYGFAKRKLAKIFNKSRPKDSPGFIRAAEVDESKIQMCLQMIRRAISHKLDIDYVLTDSWFTCWDFVNLLAKRNKNSSANQPVHLIGMYKAAKTKFAWNGQLLTYSQIRQRLGKPIRCRKLGYHYLQAKVQFKGQSVTLFFSRQGKNGKWKVFLTTNTKLSFIEMVRIYQIRWSIEVFFKEAKQLLGLGKCQSNDFDAQIADTALTMIQHMIVTLRWRFETYQSKAGLFSEDRDKVAAIKVADRLWGLLLELARVIDDLFEGEVDGEKLISRAISDEKVSEKICKLIGAEALE